MALKDNAVFVAAKGYVYTAPVGTPMPTPEQIANFNPDVFGSVHYKVTFKGSPTGGTYTLTVGTQTTSALEYAAPAGTVKAALEKLSSVGTANVEVDGDNKAGFTISFPRAANKSEAKLTATGSLTGGSTPSVTVTDGDSAISGWTTVGHTSDDDLPEFGSDGGDKEMKPTWQNKKLREISTEEAVDYVTVSLHQIEKDALTLYYGENDSDTPGVFGIESNDKPAVERAFLLVIVDGRNRIGFCSAKASIRREDSPEFATDEYAKFPIRATFMKMYGRHLFDWILPHDVS